jgi:hypothetical protein
MKFQQDAQAPDDAANPSVLPEPQTTAIGNRKMLNGQSNSVIQQNVKELMQGGAKEVSAHKMALAHSKRGTSRHKNLGKFLHSRKDGKPHGSDLA